MSEKTVQSRIQMKNDTAANWAKATNFIPKAGEIIVYNDEPPRIKIGDGSTAVGDLGFVTNSYTLTKSGNTITLTASDGTVYNVTDNNTTYSNATQSATGLMTATDKTKLDGIASGAQVNQNAFANLAFDSSIYTADSTSDTFTFLSGDNITFTTSSTDDQITISATNTTYDTATSGNDGLMSASDKTKLDEIATGANNYSLPTASSSTLGGVKVGTNLSISNGVLSATNTTYSAATTSAAGLMSATDKSKLDGIASGANAYSLPTATSSTLGGIKVGTNLSISDGVLSATNTTYSAATTSANGLMSSSDKTKLDGIATGAQVNQNAFSNVTVGSTTIAADSTTDTLTIAAGSNITLTPDATNDKITIAATNTTYSTGTSSTAGLTKLYTGTGTNTDGTMTQSAINSALSAKESTSNKSTSISSSSTDTQYPSAKAVKSYVDTAINNLPDPMIFKGSLGTDGTLTELPDAASTNTGYTYKVITAGTYASQAADVGDTFISDGSSWILIPSGDEPSGTVTSVATGVGLTGGTITSSGTIKAKLKSESSLGSSNSVTTTSSRTYAVGVDSSGYLAVNVPWTDSNTTYSAATTSAAGLMSAADKSKLDAITASADSVSFSQSLTSGTTVGTITINGTATTLYAPTNTDTHYTSKNVVGATTATSNTSSALTNGNVYLNSVENGSVTSTHKISGSGATTVTTDASGNIVISSTNTTYSAATTSAAGLMSTSDKSKLDAITASADSVSFTRSLTSGTKVGTITINGTGTDLYAPSNTDTHYTSKNVVGATTATSNTSTALTNGNVYLNSVENGAVTSTHKISGSGATTVTTDTSGNIVISSSNTTYSTATTSANGLMSSSDKSKLDAITASADAVSYSASATSGNLVGTLTINGTATKLYSPTQTTVSGNAGTATKWATARTLTIGSTGKSVDGSANVSWSLSEIGAMAVGCTIDGGSW